MRKADFGQCRVRSRLGVVDAQAEHHVFPGIFPRHQARLLKHSGTRYRHAQFAAVDIVQPSQRAQQRGLAGTAGPQQRDKLARRDVQIKPVNDPLLTKLANHITQLHWGRDGDGWRVTQIESRHAQCLTKVGRQASA